MLLLLISCTYDIFIHEVELNKNEEDIMSTEKMIEFKKSNISEWDLAISDIFSDIIPNHAEWNTLDKINQVLKKISAKPDNGLNHMLYPDSGGLDMRDSSISEYEKCIEIDTGTSNICMPLSLVFENISDEPEWCYFRLNLKELKPSGVYGYIGDLYIENLFENSHGVFENYSEYPTQPNSRHIRRILKGSLLFVAKTSFYNSLPETYNGTHNKFDGKDFRKFMEELYAAYLKG